MPPSPTFPNGKKEKEKEKDFQLKQQKSKNKKKELQGCLGKFSPAATILPNFALHDYHTIIQHFVIYLKQ